MDNKSKLVKEQLQGWDLAAQTEEAASVYIAYDGRKKWDRDEFFLSGVEDVEEPASGFFKEMDFDPAGKRMLDIGCGIGRLTLAFAHKFGEAYGVDFSSNMINLAREIHKDKPKLSFDANNGSDLSIYQDNFFDFCYSYIVFHHIAKFEVIASYIREIDRVLKPGGLFMFQINANRWVIRRAFGWIPIHYRIRDLLEKIGFMRCYNRLRINKQAKPSYFSKAMRVYYTAPKKVNQVLENTSLDTTRIICKSNGYIWYCGKKQHAS